MEVENNSEWHGVICNMSTSCAAMKRSRFEPVIPAPMLLLFHNLELVLVGVLKSLVKMEMPWGG